MHGIVWTLLLAVAAVVGATALGGNDGLVTIFWLGWRLDLSLNLFLLSLLLFILAVYSLVRGLDSLLDLPERARKWRVAQRDRQAQAALREGLALYMAGRYTRAHKACQRAVAIQADTPELALDAEFTALAHMLSAGSLHRLQDRPKRDEHLQRAIDLALLTRKPRPTEEGARLLAAECALEDRDAPRALRDLAELPPGVGRRTQALRLKLQASRLARQPMEALRTARLLAKHQGFTSVAAEGLLRTLATEALAAARDTDQLRALWQNLDAAERRDPLVVAHAARRMAELGAPAEARQWLAPLWDQIHNTSVEGATALAKRDAPEQAAQLSSLGDLMRLQQADGGHDGSSSSMAGTCREASCACSKSCSRAVNARKNGASLTSLASSIISDAPSTPQRRTTSAVGACS